MKRLLIILFTAAICMSCSKVSDRLPFRKQETALPPVPVDVLVIGSATEATTRTYVGEVKAASEMNLHFPLGGQLTSVRVHSGERVKKGQLLAEVDDTQAKSLHDAALAVLRQAEDAHARLSQMYASGGISEVKWVEMQTNLEKAQQNEIATLKSLQDCRLTAPADGILSRVDVQVGERLLPGQQVALLMNVSVLEAEFSVPEQDIHQMQIGQAVDIILSASDLTTTGVIREKSISASAIAHTFTLRAAIDCKAEDGLLPGMVCKVRVACPHSEGIVVPGQCVATTPEGPSVWVIQGGHSERRLIRSERYVKEGVLVSEGLATGDSVVVAGYQKLYNGACVTTR